MAFRQPTYHAPQRAYSAVEEEQTQARQPSSQLEESQEWILFSPAAASTTAGAQTTSTDRTRRTVGRSRYSEYGSIETAARSYDYDEDGSDHTEAVVEDEEDGELDSLDSHLHEFRAEPSIYRETSVYHEPSQESLQVSGNTVLPTHDGLGSFRVDRTAMTEGVQEHLYAFERYNPRRVKRRRESLEMGQLEFENDRVADYERTQRIEEWRLEQSRALLEEIHKETRRRRQSMSTDRRSLLRDDEEEELATLGSINESKEQAGSIPVADENDSFWTRITRRVIQDLMGIDDRLLSIIFGETLPEDDDLSNTPPVAMLRNQESSSLARNATDDSWEYRLLDRIARELGLLVNQLSDHPGAFSTYLDVQKQPLPYAGLPIIPEMLQDTAQESTNLLEASAPQFEPTISQPLNIAGSAHTSLHVGDDVDATPRPAFPIHRFVETDYSHVEFTKEEWERQLDIKMVFRYLRSRFTSRQPSTMGFTPEPSRLATSTPQDAAARAARVRQHHPLVTRQKPVERRTYRSSVPGSPVLQRRGSSGCASQSTRISAKRNSGSSRHYWDINGSIGSGSLIASTGQMGSWGEV